jgi:hypothetical protein
LAAVYIEVENKSVRMIDDELKKQNITRYVEKREVVTANGLKGRRLRKKATPFR